MQDLRQVSDYQWVTPVEREEAEEAVHLASRVLSVAEHALEADHGHRGGDA